MPAAATAAARPARPWRQRLRGLAFWLGAVGSLGSLLFVYHYLGPLAEGHGRPPLQPLIEELTGAFVVGLLFFPTRQLVRRLPLTRSRWPHRLPIYLLVMLASAAAATTLMWGLRSLLFPLAGLGSYDYGVMPLRYFMELPLQVLGFTLMVAAIHVLDALAAARSRELRAARIESSLARSQLRNLRLQLQPHFLFNALHTISSVMYEDPAAADEMLDQLAELLRSSLRTAQSDEVPLAEELALLERYLAIQRARFGARLAVTVEVDAGADALLVPSLILQPLVENAIRHGNAERAGRGAIAVRARREDGRLVLEVEDDGPGDARTGADSGSGGPGEVRTRVDSGSGGPGDVRTRFESGSGGPGEVRTRIDSGSGGPGDVRTGGDSGAACPSTTPNTPGQPAGLGLASTAERLLLLYGDAQTFSAGNRPGGGFRVRACLPARPAGRPEGAA